jgi:hypothetical protein
LMEGRRASAASSVAPAASTAGRELVLPTGVNVLYAAASSGAIYAPHAYVLVRSQPEGELESLSLVAAPLSEGVVATDLTRARATRWDPGLFAREATPTVSFAPLPPSAMDPKRYASFSKEAIGFAQSALAPVTYTSSMSKLSSEPGEDEVTFRARVVQAARERRDAAVETLKTKHAARAARLDAKRQELERRRQNENAQASVQAVGTAIDVGGALLGALFGGVRRSTITQASRAARSATRAGKERGDVARVDEQLNELEDERQALDAELHAAVGALPQPPMNEVFTQKRGKLKKSELSVVESGLLFAPSEPR